MKQFYMRFQKVERNVKGKKDLLADSMTKKRVLVFPCGTEIGLNIYEAVKYSRFFQLIGMSSCDDHGMFVYKDYIGDAPYLDDSCFIDYLKEIIKEKEIDAIFPTNDAAIALINANRKRIDCVIVASSNEVTQLCYSKKKTYYELQNVVRVPREYENYNINEFPVFVKPDNGHSSIGAEIVNNREQLEQLDPHRENKLVLEYLPGDEYTIDCFTNRFGKLIFCKARKRNRTRLGISVNTAYVEGKEYIEFAEKINERIRPNGAWFVQVKRDNNDELCLLEIASRMGGSSIASLALGVNLPLLALFNAFEYDVEIDSNAINVEIDRSFGTSFKCKMDYDVVYIDYDDCLVFENGDVNSEMIGYIFKCKNEGKQVYLLTRHEGELLNELKRLRVKEIFDGIVQIDKDERKSDYIDYEKAILIDDSFRERKEVKNSLGICTFGPEMVKALL